MSFKLIIRSIKKRPVTTTVIYLSLVLAFATSILISGYLVSEFKVDKFHEKGDRIFLLSSEDIWVKGITTTSILTDVPREIKDKYSEVEDFCISWGNYSKSIHTNGKKIKDELMVSNVSPSFFSFFDFPLKFGDPGSVLNDPGSIVLKEEVALKYFGRANVLGENIRVTYRKETKDYTITGIISSSKRRTRFGFDMVASGVGQRPLWSKAYLLLKNKKEALALEGKLQKENNSLPIMVGAEDIKYYLNDFPSLYLTGEEKTKWNIMLGIGLLILFIALFNYMNLLWAHIFERTKEITVRKIIGGKRSTIKRIILNEFMFITVFAFISAIVLFFILLPVFNDLIDADFTFTINQYTNIYVGVIIFMLFGLIAMVTWITTGINLRRNLNAQPLNPKSDGLLKKQQLPVLNAVQFAISILLIIATIIIQKQIYFIHHKDIGVDRDVYEIRLPYHGHNRSNSFKNELTKHPAFANVSVCESSPIRAGAIALYKYEKEGNEKKYSTWLFRGDHNYLSTLDIHLIKGVNFSEIPDENRNKCIINTSLKKELELKDPIGQLLPGSQNYIIGVVEDFHWNSLESKIAPAFISYLNCHSSNMKFCSNIVAKFNPGMEKTGLIHLKKIWEEFFPDEPFDFTTTGDWFNNEHAKQKRLIKYISIFCVISIFLSCIGLFAFSLFTLKRSVKEIGVRKVNGARVHEILLMLNLKFIRWIIIGFVVVIPIGWYLMDTWLENFAYKTRINWWIFVLAGAIALLIALITVSLQSWRAGNRNPVDALHYE